MNTLKPSTFIIPIVALLLDIFLSEKIGKIAADKKAFTRFSFIIIVVAFVLDYIWEMLQMPLFEGMSLNIQSTLYCGLASVADALMVLLLFYGFVLAYNELLWFKNNTAQRVLVLILTGATGAIIIEQIYTSLGNWKYSRLMPIIPIVNVGLSAVLQFMVLPLLSYYLSFYFLNKRYRDKLYLVKK